jgi:hypothetical protein
MRKKVFRRIRLLLIGVFAFPHAFAQERTITGTITDETGSPLQQATVSVENTSRNAIIDAAGRR